MTSRIADHNGHHNYPERQRFGIEVELENVGYFTNIPEWDDKPDGSLRDNGMEFITPPVGYEEARKAIDVLWREKYNRGWIGSPRCGIHVHAEVNGRTKVELMALITSYILAEPLIYAFCGAAREENIYCVPWYRAPNDIRHVVMASKSRVSFCGHLGNTCKYSGFYLEPVYRFGTVEFRMAPVFETADRMKEFLSIVDSLVTYCIGMTPQRVMDTWYNRGAGYLMVDMFGKRLLSTMYDDDVQAFLDSFDVESLGDMVAQTPPEMSSEWVTAPREEMQEAVGYYTEGTISYGDEMIDFSDECDDEDDDDNEREDW
jgi:hypothetical protein